MSQDQEIITEPSIGQTGYLSALQFRSQDKRVPYMAFELEFANVNIEALEKTISFFVKRHESLRTVFWTVEGVAKQVVVPFDKDKFGITCIDVGEGIDFVTLKSEKYTDASYQFSFIDKGPLIKVLLFNKGTSGFLFSFLIHHVLCDAWSERIIERELSVIYRSILVGEEPALAPLTIQLRDYSTALNVQIMENSNRTGEFWSSKLSEIGQILDIEVFYAKYQSRYGQLRDSDLVIKYKTQDELAAILNQQGSAMYSSLIGNSHFTRIKNFAKSSYCSASAVLYAGFYIFFNFYAGKNKPLFAALIADRDTKQKQALIGSLLGSVYLPAIVNAEKRVSRLIEETFFNVLEASQNLIYDHDILHIEGTDLWLRCDLYLNYISVNKDMLSSGLYKKYHTVDENIFYALNCMLIEYNDGLCINWRYNTALFTKELIEDMARCYEGIIYYIGENQTCSVKDVIDYLDAPMVHAGNIS
jgi:hypothetical protein